MVKIKKNIYTHLFVRNDIRHSGCFDFESSIANHDIYMKYLKPLDIKPGANIFCEEPKTAEEMHYNG